MPRVYQQTNATDKTTETSILSMPFGRGARKRDRPFRWINKIIRYIVRADRKSCVAWRHRQLTPPSANRYFMYTPRRSGQEISSSRSRRLRKTSPANCIAQILDFYTFLQNKRRSSIVISFFFALWCCATSKIFNVFFSFYVVAFMMTTK